MSTIKISQLPPLVGADANGTDVIPIVDTSLNTTNKITRSEFFKNTPSVSVSGNITVTGTVDGRDVSTDGTKLDGIEAGAEVNPTASEIKTLYESNDDTNAFTDAEKTKLSGIEAGADVTDTANVTAAGALMDSELTNINAVKALNQGVSTTNSPSFVGISLNGTAVTATATELNVLDGVTATTAELNILDGANATLAPALLANPQNYLDPENRIINGAFDFWQRGTSFTAAVYGADRWFNHAGGSTVTMSRQSFTLGDTLGGNSPTYFLRQTVSGQTLTTHYALTQQRIERVRSYAGQTITVLGWARRSSGSGNVALELEQDFGTGGSPSATVTGISPTIVTLTGSWAAFAVTFSIPSVTGKTLGSNGNDFLALNFWTSAGSDWNARTNSLGLQTIGVDLWGIHIKVGTHTADATSLYRQPELGPELARCQRYYQKGNLTERHHGGSGVQYLASVRYGVQLRAIPSRTVTNNGSVDVNAGTFVTYGDQSQIEIGVNTTAASAYINCLWTADAEL